MMGCFAFLGIAFLKMTLYAFCVWIKLTKFFWLNLFAQQV